MRVLLLLRGSAGCGKSTWIEKNGLKPYTLSADDIRLLCQSPVMKPDGTVGISQNNDKTVWNTLFRLLEVRMQKGEFTVIDATNSKTSEMTRYKQMCQDYRYRIYCVDFTDIPIEETKRRNASRDELKRVPEEVIDNMYARFATQKVPSGIKVIKPDELDTIWMKLIDLSEYKKIHHIGDIHGCYTALKTYLDENGGIKDDEFYIFCGDYIDRGIENVETLQYLISIKDKNNVLLLEGNHEIWLKLYSHDCKSWSKEFETVTKRQLDAAGIDKKDIRQLYRKLGQCAYYKYGENIYLVTHGGLSYIPDNLTFVATDQMIHGVGGYEDAEKIAEVFVNEMPDKYYQIHGHRNIKHVPIRVNDRVFNLEGRVEFGGDLRCIQLDKDGIHEVKVHNEVFKVPEIKEENSTTNGSITDLINSLRSNKYIQEKKFGNISSFNFTKDAFYGKVWDDQTTKARGLFIDTYKNKVAARAYEKFFNINERKETKLNMLQNKLQFPVTAYVKENGYLGIVSYDEYNDDLFIASKSTIDSQFAEWLKEALYRELTPENREKMKLYAKDNNVSFVFENVDMEHDPHVIRYPVNKLFLLDIVYNQMDFKKYEYETMCDVAHQLGLTPKEKAYEIANWQDFYEWYFDVTEDNYQYNEKDIEGFVIEDNSGYMVKLKLAYYKFWKFMRSISHEAIKNGYTKKIAALTTSLANEYYSWVKQLHNAEDIDSLPKDICTLRKLFYRDKFCG